MTRFCFDPSGWIWIGFMLGFIFCAAIRTTRSAYYFGHFAIAVFLTLGFAMIVMMAVKAVMEACA